MRGRSRFSSLRRIYVTLLVISIALLLMPRRWTGGLISLVQVLVPVQHAAVATADLIHPTPDTTANQPPVPASDFQAERRQREALQHEVAALAARVTELEGEVETLSATRLWKVGGRGIGASGRLIPARVLVEDLLAWRSSRLITSGSLQGIRRGAAVVSEHFTVDRGAQAGVTEGMAILLKESLIGFAEQVGTHTARVRLLSDIDTQMKVRIARFENGAFRLLPERFWLVGRGNGVMRIGDVNRRDVEDGRIRVGDLVLSDPTSDKLPVALTIGKIERIDPIDENPLLTALTVQAAVPEDQLRRVYVFDPDAPGRSR